MTTGTGRFLIGCFVGTILGAIYLVVAGHLFGSVIDVIVISGIFILACGEIRPDRKPPL